MKRHIKAFTYVDRYNIFLDIWMNYYTSFILPKDILIMYRNSSGFDLQKYLAVRGWKSVEVVEVPTSSDQMVSAALFIETQKYLLDNSDIVLYSDIDEIIFHKDLIGILNTFTDPFLTTTGFEIVQNIDKEDALSTYDEIVGQRRYGKFSEWYDKSVVLRSAVYWEDGKHSKNSTKNALDGLYLVHLNKIDINILQQTNKQTAQYYTTGVPHNRVSDIQELIQHYELDRLEQLQQIPEDISIYLKLNAITIHENRNNNSDLSEEGWDDSHLPN